MIGKNVSLIHALSDSKWCHTFISSWKLTFRMHPFCSWFRVFTEFQKQPLPNFLQLYWKETPAQVFFCKFCETSFFTEHLARICTHSISIKVVVKENVIVENEMNVYQKQSSGGSSKFCKIHRKAPVPETLF